MGSPIVARDDPVATVSRCLADRSGSSFRAGSSSSAKARSPKALIACNGAYGLTRLRSRSGLARAEQEQVAQERPGRERSPKRKALACWLIRLFEASSLAMLLNRASGPELRRVCVTVRLRDLWRSTPAIGAGKPISREPRQSIFSRDAPSRKSYVLLAACCACAEKRSLMRLCYCLHDRVASRKTRAAA